MSNPHLEETLEMPVPRSRYRRVGIAALLLAVLCVGGLWAYRSLHASVAVAEETGDSLEQRRLRVAELTPAEKEELARKQERFNALTPAEQEHLRELHADLTADPNGPQLLAVATRYHEWLKTLSTGQRAELLDMSPSERIARIERLKREEETRQFREMTDSELPQEDIDEIFAAVTQFVRENEDRIIANLNERQLEWLNRGTNERWRTSKLFFLMARPGRQAEIPMPDDEKVAQLIARLSPATQQQIEEAESSEARQDMLRRWVFAVVLSRTSPDAATPEELEAFFAELPQAQRERLESLPSDQMQHVLRGMYHQESFGFLHRGRDHRGGPDHEGPGPGPGWDGRPPRERSDGRSWEDRRRGEARDDDEQDAGPQRRPREREGGPPEDRQRPMSEADTPPRRGEGDAFRPGQGPPARAADDMPPEPPPVEAAE